MRLVYILYKRGYTERCSLMSCDNGSRLVRDNVNKTLPLFSSHVFNLTVFLPTQRVTLQPVHGGSIHLGLHEIAGKESTLRNSVSLPWFALKRRASPIAFRKELGVNAQRTNGLLNSSVNFN